MSNKRIDLTQFEGHTSDWSIQEGPLPTLFITDNDGVIATMEMDAEERYVADSLLISKAPDLLDELKRCYEVIDFLTTNCTNDEDFWIATCEPDGRGMCILHIDSWEELMSLEKSNKIEIPGYSHDSDELLLYDCDCENGRYNASE